MSQEVRANYTSLVKTLEELSHLSAVQRLLEWDQLVMMPSNGSTARGKQLEVMAGIDYDRSTNPEIGKLVAAILADSKHQSELDKWEQAVVRDAKRNYDRVTKLPKDLVQRAARLSSEAYEAWVSARKESNFSKFSPFLKQWVELRKEQAKFLDSSKDPYDVLIDQYERGVETPIIDKVFNQLKVALPPLIQKIAAKPQPNKSFLDIKFDVETQVKLSHAIAKEIGFDTESGRLDVSVHPFSTDISSPHDVRMTTRYRDNDIIEGITGTIHETGHSLYEQGRNLKYADLPVSQALSMGIHESQSLLWERMVGLSLPFWEKYWPSVQEHFPQLDKNATAEQFWRAINTVKPDFIRVEADELTYPLHIVIRYEIERGLMSGTIAVDDLPTIWNNKMKEYLGIVPENDAKGVLQDTHWSSGSFGYFPTYTLGAIYACQFFKKAEKEIPNLSELIKAGNFKPLKEWLNTNIHHKGSLIPSGDLLTKEVTGEGLNPTIFINYLTEKYSKIYGL